MQAGGEPSAIKAEMDQAAIEFKAWFDDWSEQALTVIKRRDHLILLGLAKRKKKAKAEEPTG